MLLRAIITGGGTGGHIYPALAIAKGLQNKFKNIEILYLGTRSGLEADIVPKSGLPFATVSVEGFTRPISPKIFLSALKAVKGICESLHILRKFNPHVVVGTGGYVCGPVVLAATVLGIPTVIHEQNSIPGFTNKLLARLVDRICVSFEDSIKFFPKKDRVHLTGLPIRQEILSADRNTAIQELGLSKNKTTIVITGGSRGAKSINNAAVSVISNLSARPDVQVLHVTGHSGFEETVSLLENNGVSYGKGSNIFIVPYLYQMEYALAAADVVVGRAGASFLSEIMAKGIPSILIPYPYAAANHQEFNARSLVCRSAAKMILDTNLTGEKLSETLGELIYSMPLRKRMAQAAREMGRENALNDIIEIIAGISSRK